MVDSGVVCRGTWEGREVLGIRLNWHKRYITLGPIATVLGLAFKLYDPDHLIGTDEDIGITVALVPTNLPGVEIGRRHLPALLAFQNGPNWGHDVFIPMDHVIGGVEQVGKGWKMLMSALAAGRGISLPSLSAAGVAFAAHTTGAYARIREQFHVPIGRFEAIQERLGRMAATAYLLDAARRLTCAGIDHGHKPAVVTAIMKSQATERLRVVASTTPWTSTAARRVQEGPLNYLGSLYRGGADRHHGRGRQYRHPRPHPVRAGRDPQPSLPAQGNDGARGPRPRPRPRGVRPGVLGPCRPQHRQCVSRVGPRLDRRPVRAGARRRAPRAASTSRSGATPPPSRSPPTWPCSRWAARSSARRWSRRASATSSPSSISSRRCSSAGRTKGASKPICRCSNGAWRTGFATIEARFDEIFANFPNRPAAWLLRFMVLPLGPRRRGPSDRLTQACAAILLEPSATRDRLTVDIFHGSGDEEARAARARLRADDRDRAAARSPAQGARPRHRQGAHSRA